jgi:hypothetical protein
VWNDIRTHLVFCCCCFCFFIRLVSDIFGLWSQFQAQSFKSPSVFFLLMRQLRGRILGSSWIWADHQKSKHCGHRAGALSSPTSKEEGLEVNWIQNCSLHHEPRWKLWTPKLSGGWAHCYPRKVRCPDCTGKEPEAPLGPSHTFSRGCPPK